VNALRDHQFWHLVVPWLANPMFWYAFKVMVGRRISRLPLGRVVALAAALLASGPLFESDFSRPVGSTPRSDWISQAFGQRPAYYVWLGSYVLLAAAGFIDALVRRRTPTSRLPQDESDAL
jgi:hypothetical protein